MRTIIDYPLVEHRSETYNFIIIYNTIIEIQLLAHYFYELNELLVEHYNI